MVREKGVSNMDISLAAIILSIVSLAVSMFSAGYSMANWHFSSSFVREKMGKQLEKELRWRLQLDREIASETTESKKDAMAK